MNSKEHLPEPRPHHGTTKETARKIFDQALTQALEAQPNPHVPDDFALAVMRRLPPRHGLRPPVTLTNVPRLGRRAAFAALVILFLGMAVLARESLAPGHLAYAAVEYVFAAEFILIAVWISLRPPALR